MQAVWMNVDLANREPEELSVSLDPTLQALRSLRQQWLKVAMAANPGSPLHLRSLDWLERIAVVMSEEKPMANSEAQMWVNDDAELPILLRDWFSKAKTIAFELQGSWQEWEERIADKSSSVYQFYDGETDLYRSLRIIFDNLTSVLMKMRPKVPIHTSLQRSRVF